MGKFVVVRVMCREEMMGSLVWIFGRGGFGGWRVRRGVGGLGCGADEELGVM